MPPRSGLFLVWALSALPLACTREPPAPAPAPSAAAAAPPASAAEQPTGNAAPSGTPPGTPSRRHPDHAVSIPGVLTIHAPDRENRTHGVGDEPWVASFLVTNETAQPLSVTVSDLALLSDEAGLAPANRAQALRVTSARADGIAAVTKDGVVTFTAPPKKEIELQLQGDTAQKLHVLYHVTYRHEAAFAVGDARVTGRGYAMYFRHPHLRTP